MQKSFYFQHDYNASGDAKVLFLRQQLGMEGYGIYWFILEQLAQSGGILPLKIIPVLAMQSQTQETKVKAVIEGYDLFKVVRQNFFSSRLNQHLLIRKHLSNKGKEGALLRWGNGDPNSPPISDPNAKERKGNKGKEIKEIKESEILLVGKKYLHTEVGSLPELKIGSAIELLKITKKIDLTSGEISQLWEVFKIQNLTGETHYNSLEKIYSYFLNWLNSKKINNGFKTTSASGKHASANLLIESLRADFNAGRNQST
jgi:hypothetical protein